MALKRPHGDDSATVCKNLVNIVTVTSEFKKGVCRIFAATGLQFDDRRSFGTLPFENGLECRNFEFSRLLAIISVHCVLYKFYKTQFSDSGV